MDNGKGLSIASLVLGIVSSIFAWWGVAFGIICIVCGIVGIVLAIMGKKKAKLAGAPTGMATAGLVLSIIGTVLAVIGTIACGICIAAANEVSKSLDTSEFKEAMDELSSALNG